MAQKPKGLGVLEFIVNTLMGTQADNNTAGLETSRPDAAAVDWRAIGLY